VDNLFDFLLLFSAKNSENGNISDYIEALYTKISETDASSTPLQEIISDMSAWIVKLKEESAVHSGKISDAEKRLDKLRKTVAKCLKFGIKTWIFCIEPRASNAVGVNKLSKMHPELFNGNVMCTSRKQVQQYIEESVKDIFTNVPGLGGIIMISHGERPTTCLSYVCPVTGRRSYKCDLCDKLEPWQIHKNTSEAIVRGIRAAGSNAEYISWFYQPHVRPERAPWVAETARHIPDGVVMAYNFESGAIKDQLGRFRNGGDYWLSYVGDAHIQCMAARASWQSGVCKGRAKQAHQD
jgi:hypothetical protein